MSIRLRRDKLVFFLILMSIIFALFYNIFYFDPIDGYDGEAHYNYIDHFSRYLPQSLNLPSNNDTREYFNPPIGYLVPSISQVVCRNVLDSVDLLRDCRYFYGKSTQIFQAAMYLLTIHLNLLFIKNFFQKSSYFCIEYLLLISLLSVNYRTISMIRGEPYILLFFSFLIYQLQVLSKKNFNTTKKSVLFFGLTIGMLALSRQWAFLLFPAFFVFIFKNLEFSKQKYFNFLVSTFFIGFISSGWFYFISLFRYGSFIAFNKDSIGFSFLNQPKEFYIPSFMDIYSVFTNPIRPNFSNQFISILYSDVWGDYWGYFVFTSANLDLGRNQEFIGSYLARVNIVNLPLTVFLFYSYYLIKKNYKSDYLLTYLRYCVIFSFLGYLWFLISYPALPTGDTNKATYIVQLFNILILLGSIVLVNLKNSNYKMYKYFMAYLFFLLFHNYQTFLSHFPYSLSF